MRNVLTIIVLVLLSGCSETGAVKDAITDNLKDPDSAEFGEISVVSGIGGKFACATVNARNSFGGYTGEQQIKLRHDSEDGWLWASDGAEGDHKNCVRIITDWANDDGTEAAAAADAALAGAEAAAPAGR